MANHPNRSAHAAMEHITLTTGASRISRRTEVSADVINPIRAALARDGILWAGWSVGVSRYGDGAAVYDMLLHGRPLATCWLCLHASADTALWEEAEARAPDDVRLGRPRGVPWLAVILLPHAFDIAMSDPARLGELGDAERCVAWVLCGMAPSAVRVTGRSSSDRDVSG